jgi:hypothetical protein
LVETCEIDVSVHWTVASCVWIDFASMMLLKTGYCVARAHKDVTAPVGATLSIHGLNVARPRCCCPCDERCLWLRRRRTRVFWRYSTSTAR